MKSYLTLRHLIDNNASNDFINRYKTKTLTFKLVPVKGHSFGLMPNLHKRLTIAKINRMIFNKKSLMEIDKEIKRLGYRRV